MFLAPVVFAFAAPSPAAVFSVPVEAFAGEVQDLAFQLEVFPNGEEGEDTCILKPGSTLYDGEPLAYVVCTAFPDDEVLNCL